MNDIYALGFKKDTHMIVMINIFSGLYLNNPLIVYDCLVFTLVDFEFHLLIATSHWIILEPLLTSKDRNSKVAQLFFSCLERWRTNLYYCRQVSLLTFLFCFFCVRFYRGLIRAWNICYRSTYIVFGCNILFRASSETCLFFTFLDLDQMSSTNMSATELAQQNAEDLYEKYDKYLNAGRYIYLIYNKCFQQLCIYLVLLYW